MLIDFKCLECGRNFKAANTKWTRCAKCSSHLVFVMPLDETVKYANISDIGSISDKLKSPKRIH